MPKRVGCEFGKFNCTKPVGNYLRVDPDGLVALLASVGEYLFVALDAVGMLVAKHVPLPGQGFVALPAAEMLSVPVLLHRIGVFRAENQLETKMLDENSSQYARRMHVHIYVARENFHLTIFNHHTFTYDSLRLLFTVIADRIYIVTLVLKVYVKITELFTSRLFLASSLFELYNFMVGIY